jgi:hypothetical protein
MRAKRIHTSLTLAGLAGLSLLAGCMGSGDEISEDTEAAYALRSDLSGSPDGKKTFVCHIPPGNPANAHTIHVGNPAVDAHLAHGDSLGQCDQVLVADTGTACQKRHGWLVRRKIQNIVVREGDSWKVTVCHLPPGNTDNGHAISVGASAVQAHLDHGDVLGACDDGYAGASALAKDKCIETDGGDTGTTGGDTGTGTTGGGSTDTGTTVIDVPRDNT